MSEVDPRAVVSASARIGQNVRVGAFAVVGDGVELGDDCVLEPHAVVRGPARIGRKNVFDSFCSVGGDPQDLKFGGEHTELVIGDANRFREFCTVSRGTTRRRRRHANRQRQSFHGVFPRGPRLHRRQPHCVCQWRDAGRPRGRGRLCERRGVQSRCTNFAAWAATPTSAPAPSSRRTCRRSRAWSPSAKRNATA